VQAVIAAAKPLPGGLTSGPPALRGTLPQDGEPASGSPPRPRGSCCKTRTATSTARAFPGRPFHGSRVPGTGRKSCVVADIETRPPRPVFGGFLPADLCSGDPGTRDAAHALDQCCVAGRHAAASASSAVPPTRHGADIDRLTLHVRRRLSRRRHYLYDLDVRDEAGKLSSAGGPLRCAVGSCTAPARGTGRLLGPTWSGVPTHAAPRGCASSCTPTRQAAPHEGRSV